MATYTAVAAGGDWNVSTTWSPAGVPGAADTAIFNSSSGDVTVPAAGSTCATLTINGYLGTLLLNGNLTLVTSALNLGSFTGTINFNSGDIILSSGDFNLGNASIYTILGTGGVVFAKASATQFVDNTNNKVWPAKFAVGGTGTPTIYFNDFLEVTGTVSLQNTNAGGAINMIGSVSLIELLRISGDFTLSGTAVYTTSTPGQYLQISANATQTLTASGTHQLRSPLRINKTGGVLNISGTLNYNTGTLTYVASGGTVNAGSSTLNISASTTLNTGGMSWNNVTMAANQTLLSNLNVLGNLTTQTTSVVFSGAFNINLGGNLIINITTSGANTPIVINGTGNQSWTTAGWWIENNITISKTSGTLTIGSVSLPNVYYRVGTLTYNNLGGVVDTSSTSSILNIGGATCTLNTNGINWYNISNIATSTITLTSNLTWSNDWRVSVGSITVAFSGVGSLTPTSTANLLFSQLSTITLKNNIQVANASLAGTINTNQISISGNLTIAQATNGTTTLLINGTGSQSWTHSSAVYLGTPLTINKASGALTLGATVYFQGSTFTYIAGNVDVTTNSNLFFTNAGTYNTTGLTFNSFYFATGGGNVITLASDLYAGNTFTVGGNGTINGSFNIYSGTLNINNSTSGAIITTVTYNGGSFYCSGDCTFSGGGGGGQVITTNTIYVGGNMTFNATGNDQGPANLIMTGNGTISQTATTNPIYSNIYINTGGKIIFANNMIFTITRNIVINLQRGNVDATKCTLYLPLATGTYTLINNHKINWKTVYLPSTGNISMNEFFNGSPKVQTSVLTSSTTNANITFTDNFEKIAKFVNVNGVTLTRPQQLLLLTNQPKKARNSGIRYNNQSPNGIPKGNPSVQNLQTSGQTRSLLIDDSSFIKSI